MQDLQGRLICHCEFPFQKFSVEIFIHRKKECLRIPDHPVCHRCPGDRHAILFPVLFLTAVGQSVTELLVHHPGNRTGRRHPIEHVCPAIFSFFDHWKILKFTFRTFIVFAVVFIYFQLCRDEDQFPPDKFLADLFQRSAADRTGFFFPEKIQILFFNWNTLKTFCVRGPCFSFL